MSIERIHNDEFPTKPHNCKFTAMSRPATKVPGLVFVAGQTSPKPIKEATHEVLSNLKKVLELSGTSMEKVVKYNVYLKDMKDFAAMNEVYIAFLPPNPPSRTCIQAGDLPGNSTVEIECIAQA